MTAPPDLYDLDAEAMAAGYASHEDMRRCRREQAEDEQGCDERYQDELLEDQG